jgi:hypothetical protein
MPAFLSAYCVAGIGAVSIHTGSSARTEMWWMRARGFRLCSFTARSLATSIAAAPSQFWLATPAVIDPAFLHRAQAASPSSVVAGADRLVRRKFGQRGDFMPEPASIPPPARGVLKRRQTLPSASRVIPHLFAIISAELIWLSSHRHSARRQPGEV